MQPYFFSIIIPARSFNFYFEKETLPAISKLKYHSFETIILADDISGFTNYQKKYPWLKVIKSTSRPGRKRDEGAKIAKGEYLAFIDDDSAPATDWLQRANELLQKNKKIVALGGPGVLPINATFWEQVFDEALVNSLGSGGYTYRFRPAAARFVDDYPSMNFLINKKLFFKIGGFNNDYWPGEDSKLGEMLAQQEKKHIYYDPELVVYHHRRNSISGHLKQYTQYGTMRGQFFTQGDINSIRFQYVIPSLLTMYFVLYILSTLLYAVEPYAQYKFMLLSIPIALYIAMLVYTFLQSLLRTKKILVALGLIFIIPLTHIIYGFYFYAGCIKELFKTPLFGTPTKS